MRRRGRSSTSRDQLQRIVLSRSFELFSFDPSLGSFVLLSRGGSDAAMDNSRAYAAASFLCPGEPVLEFARVCENRSDPRIRFFRPKRRRQLGLGSRIRYDRAIELKGDPPITRTRNLYPSLSERSSTSLYRPVRLPADELFNRRQRCLECLKSNFFSSIRSCSPLHRHHRRLCIVITISPTSL